MSIESLLCVLLLLVRREIEDRILHCQLGHLYQLARCQLLTLAKATRMHYGPSTLGRKVHENVAKSHSDQNHTGQFSEKALQVLDSLVRMPLCGASQEVIESVDGRAEGSSSLLRSPTFTAQVTSDLNTNAQGLF